MPPVRTVNVARPSQSGHHGGLAYGLWLPPGAARGGVVILHGAGSVKENHHDFARVALAAGLAAVTFDQRGHGESEGPMDGRAIDDVVAMAALLREASGDPALPVALRGSSMGGYLAIVAAAPASAGAVVAICPAPAESLIRGLRDGRFSFEVDINAVEKLLLTHDLFATVASMTVPLMILHAQGDEQVPVEHSRELIAGSRLPGSRLIAVPGGHHRTVQHDEELQAVSVRFIGQALRGAAPLR